MSERIALARQGVFRTIQGEGALSGVPMIFVRLAGCGINCPECDTNYAVASRVTVEELAEKVRQNLYGSAEWLWVTGGDPRPGDAHAIRRAAQDMGLKVALATSGEFEIEDDGRFDFVSVSPHAVASWIHRRGDQLNVVPGLNGLKLSDLDGVDLSGFPPSRRYVTPLADREGRLTNLRECIDFVTCRPGWRLGHQSHLCWRLP